MRILVRRRKSDSRCTFVYPLPRTPRVALFDSRIQPDRRVRLFDSDASKDLRRLAAFQPQAFAGSLEQLRTTVDAIGATVLQSFDIRLVVVFTTAGSPLLSRAQRDELWSTFRAPAFEQYVSTRGELIASECEAHAGLHVRTLLDPQLLTNGVLDAGPCGCGQSAPRISPEVEPSVAAV